MIAFTEILEDGEHWELFARDFLQEQGFYIEVTPNRGADGGRDIIVTEKLEGRLGNYEFRWIVSCKHFAKSNKSVQERDELNILERVKGAKADGFIGFYSTLPATGLSSRLKELREANDIKDFKLFDGRLIENQLIQVGYSKLLMRYFPLSYKKIRPRQALMGKYVPLECAVCERDLLERWQLEGHKGIIAFAKKSQSVGRQIDDIYWSCQGGCDEQMREYYRNAHASHTSWRHIGDLLNPALFLHWVFSQMNNIREGRVGYSDDAYEKMKLFTRAAAQVALREMTKQEEEQAREALEILSLGF